MIIKNGVKAKFDVELIVIACSAGGIVLVQNLLSSLPKRFPLPVIVVIHRSGQLSSTLEQLVQMHCAVRVKEAEEKEPLMPSTVYFAPGGYHLLIEKDRTLSLDVSEQVKYCRPSIDVTLQSAADVYGQKMMAILLSGANDDGADGMHAVSMAGGLTVVQDPEDAEVGIMPQAALDRTSINLKMNADELMSFVKGMGGAH